MIKAIFFDIDGTLVSFEQKTISDQLRADLKALQGKGVKIFICTGRARQDLERTGMLRDVEFDGYVTLNGQHCYDKDGVYRDVTICREDLENACKVLAEHPELTVLMEGNGETYINQFSERARELFLFLHTEPYEVRSIDWLLEGRVYQFVPLVEEGGEDQFLSVMPHCVYTRWHPKGIDILPADGGKATGIRATLERYGLEPDELMAFGDGENDASMLQLAGIGVAMGNGEERIKALADYVTAPAWEDGVSQALRHFGLLD